VAVRGAVLRDNPDAVAAFVRGWFKAVDFWKVNPIDGNIAAAAQLNVEASTISLDGIKLNTLSDNQALFVEGETTASIYHTAKLYADFFVEIGSLTKRPDIDKLLNPAFLK
jgi:NitT/TauT family transport system substrate-binding protein